MVRSHISEFNEIAEPIPPLEAGEVLTMISAPVKFNNTKCEPVMHLKCSSGSVPDSCSTALKRHRPVMRQFRITENLNPSCIAYRRDHLVKGHDGQIDGVRKCKPPDLKESKRGHTSFDATAVVCVSLRDSNWYDPDLLNEMSRMLELPAAVTHVKLKTDGKGALTFLWWDEGVLLDSLERATPPRRVLNKACRLSGGSVRKEICLLKFLFPAIIYYSCFF